MGLLVAVFADGLCLEYVVGCDKIPILRMFNSLVMLKLHCYTVQQFTLNVIHHFGMYETMRRN